MAKSKGSGISGKRIAKSPPSPAAGGLGGGVPPDLSGGAQGAPAPDLGMGLGGAPQVNAMQMGAPSAATPPNGGLGAFKPSDLIRKGKKGK
jgi:hypothetical protein